MERKQNALTGRARLCLARSEYSECIRFSKELLADDPENCEALFLLGAAAVASGENELAQTASRSLLALDPEDALAHHLAGYVASNVGHDPVNAESHFRKSLRLSPGWAEASATLASFLAGRGRIEEGITVARKALRNDPENLSLLRALHALYRLNKEEALAQEFSDRALQADPEDAQSHLDAGILLLGAGERTHASNRFLEALRIDPSDKDAIDQIVDEKVFALPPYRKRLVMKLETGIVLAALAAPLIWWLISILFPPAIILFWLSLGLLAIWFLHTGGYYFLRWFYRRQLLSGKV